MLKIYSKRPKSKVKVFFIVHIWANVLLWPKAMNVVP